MHAWRNYPCRFVRSAACLVLESSEAGTRPIRRERTICVFGGAIVIVVLDVDVDPIRALISANELEATRKPNAENGAYIGISI